MTVGELKEKIKTFKDDMEVVICLETYDCNSTWDSQAFAYESHEIKDISTDYTWNEFRIQILDTIKIGN